MEEQWINDLRQRFADREQAAPDGLWDSIEAAMADRGVASGNGAKRQTSARVVPIWFKRVAAVAACVMALGGATLYFISRSGNGGIATTKLADNVRAAANVNRQGDEAAESTTAVDNEPGLVAQTLSRLTAMVSDAVVNRRAEAGADSLLLAANSTTAEAETPASASETNGKKSTPNKDLDSRLPDKKSPNDNLYASQHNRKLPKTQPAHRQSGMSFGVYGMGMTSMGNNIGDNEMRFYSEGMQQDGVFESDAMLAASPDLVKGVSSSDPATVKAKHHQPVKFGASARFKLTDRVGVETGAFYTYLSSDFSNGDETGGYKTRQKLHYVGVPLKLTYSVVKSDRLDVYGGVGGAVEVGVSGNSDTEYYNNNKLEKTERTDVREKRPQYSATVSAGVQYNVNDQVGIYAEPGISYYIDNGSSVKNFYKHKPWNASLSLGLRFTIK